MDYSLLGDEELVYLCKGNDSEALSFLTAKYMKKARLSALSFKDSSVESEDLVQEAMIGFLSAVYSFRNDCGCSFETYASRCIRNRIISVMRTASSKKRVPSELVVPLEEETQLEESSPSPEENFFSEKEAEYISTVISSSLTKQENKIFMLHLAGMKYEEIAKSADISVKAVDSTLQRARKKLREKLSFYK